MNYIQRSYDRNNRSNFNIKINNSYFHFINMQKIYDRKPVYNTNKRLNYPRLKTNPTQLQSNYFVMRENEVYKKIINGIRSTKAKPKLNDYYRTKEEKLRDYRRQNRTLEKKKLVRENSSFRKRLKTQKSALRIREIDKDYKENHLKMLERLKKKNTLILPSINRIGQYLTRSPRNNRKNSNYEYSLNASSFSKEGEPEKKSVNSVKYTE